MTTTLKAETDSPLASPIRIMVVEDHARLRNHLASFIDGLEGMKCVATAEDGCAALASISSSAPNIVLIDLEMPKMNGLRLIRRIRSFFPNIKTLVLTAYSDLSYVRQARHAGAFGYVVKSNPGEVIEALQAVANGKRYFAKHLDP